MLQLEEAARCRVQRRHFPAPCALEQSKKLLVVVLCRRHSVYLQARIRM
jgi:hypothetical protein